YETLRKRGVSSPDLFRDQGSAYMLIGYWPQAILAFHRGLRLAPGDADLRMRATYAREQAAIRGGPNHPIPLWSVWLTHAPRMPPTFLLLLTIMLYTASCVSFTGWRMTGRAQCLRLGMLLVMFSLLPGLALAAEEWQRHDEERRPLVVISSDGVFLRK